MRITCESIPASSWLVCCSTWSVKSSIWLALWLQSIANIESRRGTSWIRVERTRSWVNCWRMSPFRRQVFWSTFFRNYWKGRTQNIPCSIRSWITYILSVKKPTYFVHRICIWTFCLIQKLWIMFDLYIKYIFIITWLYWWNKKFFFFVIYSYSVLCNWIIKLLIWVLYIIFIK